VPSRASLAGHRRITGPKSAPAGDDELALGDPALADGGVIDGGSDPAPARERRIAAPKAGGVRLPSRSPPLRRPDDRRCRGLVMMGGVGRVPLAGPHRRGRHVSLARSLGAAPQRRHEGLEKALVVELAARSCRDSSPQRGGPSRGAPRGGGSQVRGEVVPQQTVIDGGGGAFGVTRSGGSTGVSFGRQAATARAARAARASERSERRTPRRSRSGRRPDETGSSLRSYSARTAGATSWSRSSRGPRG
jgi:hypothetical protein